MKYESTILKRLIDTYGVVGNPHYISEIIKEFIVRGKECFPNLFTYQADWLAHIDEFGLNPTYTVSYTGQSIYAPNTLERPVKSAILSGSTKYRDIDTGEFLETFEEGRNLELVSVKMPVLTTTGKNLLDFDALYEQIKNLNTVSKTEDGITIGQPGYTNGKVIFTPKDTSKRYVASFKTTDRYGVVLIFNYTDGTYSNIWGNENGAVSTQGKTVKDICFTYATPITSTIRDIIIEEYTGDAHTYEPYKSNILTVNEPVELRGIGDVQDTLDLMTGEVSQNLIEFEFNEGDYFASTFTEFENTLRWQTTLSTRQLLKLKGSGKIYSTNFISDKSNNDFEHIRLDSSSPYANVVIYLSKTKASTYEELKTYLKNNPFTIVAEKAEKSIKTVDLSILDQNGQNVKQLMSFNGGTHFITKSLEGSPLPTVSVSVETDLEETLMMCSLEGNTL